MKKIIADKSDDVVEIIDRILEESDEAIALVIPKSSALGKSVRNFNLLKREMDGAGKTIIIESVDENVLAFAKQAGIEASHPLWRSVRGSGGISDIVAHDEGQEQSPKSKKKSKKTEKKAVEADEAGDDERSPESEPIKLKVHTEEEIIETSIESEVDGGEGGDEDDEAREAEAEAKESEAVANRFFTNMPDDDGDGQGDDSGGSSRFWWILAGVVVIAAIVVYVLTTFFNHADIAINFKQTPWSYKDNFVADKSVSAINPSGNVIPAQIFTSNKDVTQSYPASSVQNVSQKARGTITIYNAYNSSPQELVATTRFVTPDGKLFRLVSNVTVPGAQVVNGQITPSSITAAIVADQPGPDYNIGPVAKLTIPGFQKDQARYNGFYGAITTSTTGGYVGKKAVPTAADVNAAKASTTAILESSLSSGFSASYPNNFKILDGATTYQVTKLVVSTSTDDNGNFTVFGEVTLEAIGFDESALKAYLLSLAQNTEENSVFASLNPSYSNVQANFTTGQVKFTLTAQGSLEPAFSASDFTATILGKSISEARSDILALPQLGNGTISVWPLWLMHIPSDPSKIHVTAQ
ncbi:MAG TPA: hypothetical protein VMU07_04340 [Candidatus Paceibacterota bacterium]|nr:hypothetical protein [Candidatus Paceibacterota bacterium]